ncbi:GNAT family N-acetyltransferase [Flavobacterium sp. N1994]|uniref:GNAT family N-acetyltransferase n=1 Tax=Flavobacterium sp. N1994 TaxID=2986827 RepID=UPI002221FAEA|nr:GNAT family N-acetyltransferase [Flavobacterium sp. N1994]
MSYQFRLATLSEVPAIWGILQQAIQRRKADGSNQWQDGYPNPEVVTQDIEKGVGYLITFNTTIIAYTAILINDEPEYDTIEGQWLTHHDFVVYHRVAVSDAFLGQGVAKRMLAYIEDYARQNQIYSLKVDTNFDNAPMLTLLQNNGYVYCGEVYFRGSPRKAFEKVLSK